MENIEDIYNVILSKLKTRAFTDSNYIGVSCDTTIFLFENKVNGFTISGFYVHYSQAEDAILFKRIKGIKKEGRKKWINFSYPLIND